MQRLSEQNEVAENTCRELNHCIAGLVFFFFSLIPITQVETQDKNASLVERG